MAAGYGHVHNIKFAGEHCPNIDAATPSPLNTAGIGSGVQLDMRHSDLRRALHEVVTLGNTTGLRWSGAHRLLWGNSFANTQLERAAGIARKMAVCRVDVAASRPCDRHLRGRGRC